MPRKSEKAEDAGWKPIEVTPPPPQAPIVQEVNFPAAGVVEPKPRSAADKKKET